MYIINEYVISC